MTPSTARTRPRGVVNDVRRSVTSSSAPCSRALRLGGSAHSAASRMSKRRATRSPIRLNASTVRNSISAREERRPPRVLDGLAVLGDHQPPRRLGWLDAVAEEGEAASAASRMPTPVNSTDTSAGTTLGRISRNRTRGVLAPRLRAASTYSRLARLSVWARTMRLIGAIDNRANVNTMA